MNWRTGFAATLIVAILCVVAWGCFSVRVDYVPTRSTNSGLYF